MRSRLCMLALVAAVLNAAWLAPSSSAPQDSEILHAGQVLTFGIIRAFRNYGFKDGMVAAEVSVSVEGGSRDDWMATAVDIAEQSILGDVTFAKVEVYSLNPWSDLSPTEHKLLAKVYYSGPAPKRSPWPTDQWAIFAVDRASTLADIEFDVLQNQILETLAAKVSDRNKLLEEAGFRALALIVQKYKLPFGWQASMDGWSSSRRYDRELIRVTDTHGAEDSIFALQRCLSVEGTALIHGCVPKLQ